MCSLHFTQTRQSLIIHFFNIVIVTNIFTYTYTHKLSFIYIASLLYVRNMLKLPRQGKTYLNICR